MLGQARLRSLIETVARTIIEHADELTELDSAIGDGDHGANMKRGFETVLANLDSIAAKPLPEALKAAGTQLVMKVGGAAGPLYRTLFISLGKSLPEPAHRKGLRQAVDDALAAVKARGKADGGQETMLDVLAPVQQAPASGAAPAEIAARAQEGAEATIPMKATRGRASFLGDRSI